MNVNLMDYVVEQAFVLVPVLYVVGAILKQSKLKDWLIPWVLLICGIVGAITFIGFNANAIIQGILVAGVTVFGNQLIKQTTEKKEE